MVERRNRSTGEPFLGCSRFPKCQGTRPLRSGTARPKTRARPRRPRLSLGGRPRDLADYSELLVARIVGRDLTRREGCLVQLVALLAFFGLVYWFLTSGLYLTLVTWFAEWYADQITLPGAPSPTPTPG